MHRLGHLVVATIAAAILTVAVASSASARNFSASSATFRTAWARLSFTEPVFGFSVVCPLTLEGSLHARTFVKGTYNLIGSVTRAVFGTAAQCTGGEWTVLAEALPWNIRYQSFTGTLPNITSLRTLVSGAALRQHINAVNASCLFTSRETLSEHLTVRFNREAGGIFTSAELGGEITSNEGCVLGSRIRQRFSSGASAILTELGTTTRIRVTLI
jgi:hypothetical protein